MSMRYIITYLVWSTGGPYIKTLETLDYTIRIGSTPTFLYFDLYLHTTFIMLWLTSN